MKAIARITALVLWGSFVACSWCDAPNPMARESRNGTLAEVLGRAVQIQRMYPELDMDQALQEAMRERYIPKFKETGEGI